MSLRDDPRVRDFLEQVAAPIRSAEKRRQVQAEILDHIKEALVDGRKLEDALHALGEPAQLGSALSVIHRPYWIRAQFQGVLACIFALCGILTLSCLNRLQMDRISRGIASPIDQHLARFLEDQTRLEKISVFNFPGKNRDAGPLLNPLIGYELSGYTSRERKTLTFLDHQDRLGIPASTSERLKSLDSDWVHHSSEGSGPGILYLRSGR